MPLLSIPLLAQRPPAQDRSPQPTTVGIPASLSIHNRAPRHAASTAGHFLTLLVDANAAAS